MARSARQDDEAPCSDSFLDVVTNIVGILIILVMVVGMRVKNMPVTLAISDGVRKTDFALQKSLAGEQSLHNEAAKIASQLEDVQRETAVQGQQRDIMATVVSVIESKIQSHRQKMDAAAQTDFDLQRSLSETKFQLEQLDRNRVETETAPTAPIVIESYPTPLSHTVDGDEVHFQLSGGQITVIPLDELVEALKDDSRRKKYKLNDLPEMTDTVGPIGGFRMRYTFERHDISPETAMQSGVSGSYARLKRWTLIPVSNQMGEPVDAALAQGSEFRRALARYTPQRTTITIWTYPDSFAEFRRLKKELYQLGFAAAGRPLPEGSPIAGSPEGQKSAAE